jgi:hypothetical protein
VGVDAAGVAVVPRDVTNNTPNGVVLPNCKRVLHCVVINTFSRD